MCLAKTMEPRPASAIDVPFSSSRISVLTVGTGPDVVLIPGMNSSPRIWASTVAALPGYRYHFVHVCGFAGQPAAGNKEGPVMAPVVDEIARYIKEAHLDRPALIGHSMGGTIGMMLAIQHPGAASRLMVIDTIPFLGLAYAGPEATAEKVGLMADRIATDLRAATQEQRAKRTGETIAFLVNTETMRAAAIEDSLASDPDVGARAFHELIVTNLIPELKKITVPLTVLYVILKGAPVTPEQVDCQYKSLYMSVQDLTLKRIPNSAHFIMWDQPQRFQAEVRAFLDRR